MHKLQNLNWRLNRLLLILSENPIDRPEPKTLSVLTACTTATCFRETDVFNHLEPHPAENFPSQGRWSLLLCVWSLESIGYFRCAVK